MSITLEGITLRNYGNKYNIEYDDVDLECIGSTYTLS